MPGRALLAMLLIHGLAIALLTWILQTGEQRQLRRWGQNQVQPPAQVETPPARP